MDSLSLAIEAQAHLAVSILCYWIEWLNHSQTTLDFQFSQAATNQQSFCRGGSNQEGRGGFWKPECCDSLFWRFVKTLLLSPPQLWELIGGEKPGWMPRWSRLFYEDWRRGRRGIQALACVLARVSPRRETQVWPRRPDGRPLPRLAYPCFGWAAESCRPMCVPACLCVRDYMVCVSVCARVCVWLLKDLLFGAVNFNDVCQL